MKPFVHFDVVGCPPVPWSTPNIGNATKKTGERYRFTSRNKALTFWQEYVRSNAEGHMKAHGLDVFVDPVFACVEFRFRNDDPATHGRIWCPKVEWNSKKGEYTRRGSGCPDVDNLFKSTMDPLQGVVFGNDSQVCGMTAHRVHAATDGALIYIWQFEPEDEFPGI